MLQALQEWLTVAHKLIMFMREVHLVTMPVRPTFSHKFPDACTIYFQNFTCWYRIPLLSCVCKILPAEFIIDSSRSANVTAKLHPLHVMDGSALSLYVCHYLPIWAVAIYQHPKVLPKDLLALSPLPWYPQQQGVFLLLRPWDQGHWVTVWMLSKVSGFYLSRSGWREQKLLCWVSQAWKIIVGLRRTGETERSQTETQEEDTTAVLNVGWTSGAKTFHRP